MSKEIEEKVRELVRYGVLAIFGADRESALKYNAIAKELKAIGKDDMIIEMIRNIIKGNKKQQVED